MKKGTEQMNLANLNPVAAKLRDALPAGAVLVFAASESAPAADAVARDDAPEPAVVEPGPFPPLARETRELVTTECAAFHLNRRPQTLRQWACTEAGPIRPVRVFGRLGWRVADIRALLAGGAK